MRFLLHDTVVDVTTASRRLATALRGLIAPAFHTRQRPDVRLVLELRDGPVNRPAADPFFVDEAGALPGGIGALAVFPAPDPGRVLLFFAEGGLADVPLADAGAPGVIHATVNKRLLTFGRLEDLIFTSLAPLLRRRGRFLVHAFAAREDARVALIVGPSGSGKTTSGLALVTAGWKMLANDVVLLFEQGDQVWAAPMPGHVTVSARSVALLPVLQPLIADLPAAPDGKRGLDPSRLTDGVYAAPAPVTAVFFPSLSDRLGDRVVEQGHSHCRPETPAVGLARLMEESIDRWDRATLHAHVHLLEQLTARASLWGLHLTPDIAQLPALIAERSAPRPQQSP